MDRAKLSALRKYLPAYTTALKKQKRRFRTAYIDAFAGTGYRNKAPSGTEHSALDFEEFRDEQVGNFLDGSARIALEATPPFDAYYFIERNEHYARALEQLKTDFPSRASAIRIKHGDAEKELDRLCNTNWPRPAGDRRAVLFLDPYGMSVGWRTIECIAATKAIDLWYLFPLGIGVNRLLTRDGDIPVEWANRLTYVFGTEDWKEAFYTRRTNLFGEEELMKKATFESIRDFLLERLQETFPAVAPNPRMLRNSTGNPLYLLCFAAANERGGKIALKIAKHILDHI